MGQINHLNSTKQSVQTKLFVLVVKTKHL